MGKMWHAFIDDAPQAEEDRDPACREDPQDWKIQLVLRDREAVIYVTFTGTVDAAGGVIPAPEEEVEARIDAMLAGLNAAEATSG